MATVECYVEEKMIEGDGRYVAGVHVECLRCGHTTQSFGTSERSVKRCLVLMKEECGYSEENYYITGEYDE